MKNNLHTEIEKTQTINNIKINIVNLDINPKITLHSTGGYGV
jgi:hypothetical protein